ncbi:MAG: prepilin-type N-terminal cleavage/methylation domain-containing protein [Phycisphaerae bacterium]|jgi:prepilin-type N-terminal cleavage/methylation domain-containing protein
MYFHRKKYGQGVTLIEALVAMAILAIAALGALNYQFYSAKHAHIARLEMTATRTAQLLLEDWKSNGGSENYDPTSLGIGIVDDDESNYYRIEVDNLPMYIRLVHRDVDEDQVAGVTLREITVICRWRADFSDEAPQVSDPHLTFTTYCRLDD